MAAGNFEGVKSWHMSYHPRDGDYGGQGYYLKNFFWGGGGTWIDVEWGGGVN